MFDELNIHNIYNSLVLHQDPHQKYILFYHLYSKKTFNFNFNFVTKVLTISQAGSGVHGGGTLCQLQNKS